MAPKVYKLKHVLIGILIIVSVIFLIRVNKIEGFKSQVPTFHILIATGGRNSLERQLNSLKGELNEGDAITIVYDGKDRFEKSGFKEEWIEGFKCKVNVIVQETNLGFWGHGIRNKYTSQLSPKTTFVMNADDDDAYYPGSFDTLRMLCRDPHTLYITKMNYDDNEDRIIPMGTDIIEGDISTQNGVIPFDIAPLGIWGNRYGGDFMYYDTLKNHAKNIKFLDTLIYRMYRV